MEERQLQVSGLETKIEC